MRTSVTITLILVGGVLIVSPLVAASTAILLLLGLAHLLVVLLGYVFLAKMYFFRTPLRGVILATALYVLGIIVSRT